MALPTTREQFKEFCLRKLGFPVVDINVDDEQLEDRIDDALQYYMDYHFDGSQKVYLKHQVSATDKTNGYITIPDTIQGITRIFDLGVSYGSSNMFSVTYQIALNDFYNLSSFDAVHYKMAMTRISEMQQMLSGHPQFRFNRHTDKLYIDTDWTEIEEGSWIVVEAYQKMDETANPDIWKDRWLIEYATQLFKKQWGDNTKKFAGIQLPGGITLDGQRIYDEAVQALDKMEQEMISSYSLPCYDLIG